MVHSTTINNFIKPQEIEQCAREIDGSGYWLSEMH